MFGYIKPRVGELLVKEYELYKAVYCGLCIEGGKKVSRLTRFLLSDDFVFLAILRMAVTDAKPSVSKKRCPYSLKKKSVLTDNECITYSCAAFAVLTYQKLLDDIRDSKGIKKLIKRFALPYMRLMNRRTSKMYPTLLPLAEKHLSRLSEVEKCSTSSIDNSAEPFAMLVADFCAEGTEGEQRRILYECGYHLGRYIYIIDAFEDCFEDEKNGEFNCLNTEFGSAENTVKNNRIIYQTLRDSINRLCLAFGLASDCGYNSLIQAILMFGSEDAFERVKGRLYDRSI